MPPQINQRYRLLVWTITAAALLYSGAHFVQSGILFPIAQQNVSKFEEETPALKRHIESGGPVRVDNAVQYGPVFFFLVEPLLRYTHNVATFAAWLYAAQIVSIAVALTLTLLTLLPIVRDHRIVEPWLFAAGLAVLWLNFAPLYTILVIKSVETWELALLAVGLYAYVRGRLWIMAFAVAAASLIKILPLMFVAYLLFTNRRAFARTCVALAVLLAISHVVYGPDMGLFYFPTIAKAARGQSYGLLWHENLSVKAAVAKLIGKLDVPINGRGGSTLVMTDEQFRVAGIIGDIVMAAGLALVVWGWLRVRSRSYETIVWEWAWTEVAMLILSPNSTYEYITLALGAVSFAVLAAVHASVRGHARVWWLLGPSLFFIGVLLPRQLQNRLTFVETLARWNGYGHLTASEAYQFYCFPLVGLLLLVAAIWQLRPASSGLQRA